MRKVKQPVCKVQDLPESEGRVVPLGVVGGECALFRSGDRIYAVGSLCPHQNTPLDGAPMEFGPGGSEIVCLRHGYRFDPRTGDCLTIGGYGLPVFEVVVEEGTVFVSYWQYE